MMTILWLIAVVLVIAGIYVILARRDLLWGIVLIVVGLLVGPGGVSIFT
ncbi:MAG TPA: GPGG-motif small membrane protein [Spirillospora sp.]